MEDLIEFRRKRATGGQYISHNKPYIKLQMPVGRFVIFNKTAELLNVRNGDAIMFSFSKRNKCGYIYKEDPQDDSYFPKISGREYYRFTSKDLGNYFIEVFDLPATKKAFYFEVLTVPNNKGQFRFTYQAKK